MRNLHGVNHYNQRNFNQDSRDQRNRPHVVASSDQSSRNQVPNYSDHDNKENHPTMESENRTLTRIFKRFNDENVTILIPLFTDEVGELDLDSEEETEQLDDDKIAKLIQTHIYPAKQQQQQQQDMDDEDEEEEAEICPICQVEYEGGERIGRLGCGHDYHEGCIKRWLLLRNVCPLCKRTAL